MQSELIVALQEANREISGLLSKLSENSVEANPAVLSPGELKALSEKLAPVAKLLDHVSPAQPKPEPLQAAISEYVRNLEKLKNVLEKVQDSLGKQRERLKQDFEHLNSTRAWVETFRAANWT
jgi:chromosome segregation ATPase